MSAAAGGESIRAGVPSPASLCGAAAATAAGGLTSGGGLGEPAELIGWLEGPVLGSDGETERARARRVREVAEALQPLVLLPARARGRRAMAEAIGAHLGVGVQQVYRLEARLRHGGHTALARMGRRADRGARRRVVSAAWEGWCGAAAALRPAGESLAAWVAALTARLAQCVRSAWLAGATGARQAWLKASAELGRQLVAEGWPQGPVVTLLSMRLPRDWVEAEGRQFRVAARARRDAKGAYDHHITPVLRTAAGLKPGDVVCGDVSPLDIPVKRPDGSIAYARMIVWHDVASNWLHLDLWLCDKGQGVRREHVATSFARLCEQAPFGSPRRLYLDNGSEYRWDDMLDAWRELTDLTCQQLAVDVAEWLPAAGRVTRSIPYHPRGKRVEGQFGNLRHWLAWSLGYVGGNRMAKKTANLGKAPQVLDYDQVRDWLARELADYHVTPQGAEHMGGLSPQQRIDQFLSGDWRPARVDRMALMLAFSEREQRTVTRGAVSWGGRQYVHDALMQREGRVLCARPRVCGPDDDYLIVFEAGRGASNRGAFLCVAGPAPVYGLLERAGAEEAGRRRKAFRLLTAERFEAGGGALDEQRLAGFRAEMLGLPATLTRAEEVALPVTLPEELAQLRVNADRHVSEATRARLARRDAAREAESLARLAFESDEVAAARALGF